ncbi:MAG: 2,3-bisphosphoglycerate-independent phosphoglycerate mutase [Bacillales bacterium]|nr:2,3-bisphosphoglycerate-independent phosphoglycerate mutase [Bacillales bacterium]MDY6003758.1 2,3-bisphosphoglycerate-independent phosphoglycerate mutase [Bacilli bacterium]
MNKRPVMLIIMDGYGIAPASESNAISRAKKPNLDRIFSTYDTKQLNASGDAVGLPEGQMGNSEVGHMNIGAGRIVRQSLSRINYAIKTGEFNNNKAILDAIENAKKNNSKFHIFGLCSTGGIHSHVDHICAIANLAHSKGIENVYYHAFLDGRDTAPTSGKGFLEYVINNGHVKVATVGGRYYGMDRDKNYDRIQVAYDCMTIAKGEYFEDPLKGIQTSYDKGVTDEFVVPFVSDKNGMISDNDSIVFANFRPDRAIQIATCMSNPDNIVYNKEKPYRLDYSKGPKNVFFVSMMKYADTVKGELAFGLQSFDNLFGDVISKNNMTQLRIAETEKYAHVTFFFDGGADRDIKGADRILVNSPKVATYDLKPEMSAYEVTDKVIDAINSKKYDTIILNFANCDMVGHTGVIDAAIKAVEAVDDCVGKVVDALDKVGGVALISADHGNAEKMKDENGNVYTAHTTNPVPVVITDKSIKLHDGILSDIAPTLLELLGIEIPSDMTSKSLIEK